VEDVKKKEKLVLIVDDEPAIIEIVELLLKTEGHQVICAMNGEDGLELAKKHQPDAMILDVMMPKMSGYMVTSLISREKPLKKLPIMLLTATAQIAGNVMLQLPTKYKLSKPFKPEELLSMLEKMLKESTEQ
jgi:two-component system alkaline phosphatase synthesis response regulator PhoP